MPYPNRAEPTKNQEGLAHPVTAGSRSDYFGGTGFRRCRARMLLVALLLLVGGGVFAAEGVAPPPECSSDTIAPQSSGDGMCADSAGIFSPTYESLFLPSPVQQSRQSAVNSREPVVSSQAMPAPVAKQRVILHFFWGNGCPHCEEERRFLDDLKSAYPSLEIHAYEVWHDKKNAALLADMLKARGMRFSGVPVTFIHDRVFEGFSQQSKMAIAEEIKKCSNMPCADPEAVRGKAGPAERTPQAGLPAAATTAARAGGETDPAVNIPLLGELDTRKSSLPVLTLVIAGMDSFNPCAFFVLLTLLGLLVHVQSRNKILLVGGTFVFFSGFIYFLFMAAWLNLFLVMGNVAAITLVAGTVSLLIAGINIKDFFLFKQGVSLTLPEGAKPRLFDRMRKLLRSDSLVSTMIGAMVLAVVANFYELLCTAGFPMVFTRILTLNNLSTPSYYLYLVLYNLIYVVPMFVIVLVFTFTLGKRQLSAWQGRVLKLVSGAMMLGLGIVLLVDPALLNSGLISLIIMLLAVGGSLLLAAATKIWER